MSIDTQYLACFPYEVEHRIFDTVDRYGTRTWTIGQTYKARIVEADLMIRDVRGREARSRITVWIYGAPGISVKDRLLLPDFVNERLGEEPGDTFPILQVKAFPDEFGAHHEKILIQ